MSAIVSSRAHFLLSFLFFFFLVWFPIPSSGACLNSCSGQGICNSNNYYNVCQCNWGYMTADCSLKANASLLYGAARFSLEFTYFPSGSSSYAYFKATTTELAWFGGIWNVGPDGMSSGDSWFWYHYADTGAAALSDRYSNGRSTPSVDSRNDLLLTNSYTNSTHWVFEFTRLLNTRDSNDIVFSTIPGSWSRFMWCKGGSGLQGWLFRYPARFRLSKCFRGRYLSLSG
jgi:hypothetical protein